MHARLTHPPRPAGNAAPARARTTSDLAPAAALAPPVSRGPSGTSPETEADRAVSDALASADHSPVAHAGRATTTYRLTSRTTGGRSLPPEQRSPWESRWGFDFSRVRVHTDERSDRDARALRADAYTVGGDIVFAAGRYDPGSVAGQELLGHELAHVVQQSGGGAGLSATPIGVQRRIGDGHDLSSPWLAGDVRLEGAFDNEADNFLRQGSKGRSVERVQQLLFFLGFDIGIHGADGDFGPDTDAAVRAFQSTFAPPVDGIIGPITIGALDARASQPEPNRTTPNPVPAGPPTAKPLTLSVDRIDVIDAPGGAAIGGFPAITGGASLDVPGPFNSPTEVKNSLQVHFHLDHGSSADLTPLREIQRTATLNAGVVLDNPPDQVLPPGVAGPPAPGGFTGVLIANDGPAAHEIQRPDAQTIVVADAPGLGTTPPGGLTAAQYPVTYRAHFIVTMNDARNAPIARANYDVLIDKRAPGEVPNTENRVVATDKRDFVRGKTL